MASGLVLGGWDETESPIMFQDGIFHNGHYHIFVKVNQLGQHAILLNVFVKYMLCDSIRRAVLPIRIIGVVIKAYRNDDTRSNIGTTPLFTVSAPKFTSNLKIVMLYISEC